MISLVFQTHIISNPPKQMTNIESTIFYILGVLLIWLIFMFFRNKKVGSFKRELDSIVYEKIGRKIKESKNMDDINSLRKYELYMTNELDRHSYEKMVFMFWKPLNKETWYPDLEI